MKKVMGQTRLTLKEKKEKTMIVMLTTSPRQERDLAVEEVKMVVTMVWHVLCQRIFSDV